MTRLTDAELAAMEEKIRSVAELFRAPQTTIGEILTEDFPRMLAELKAERERCAELRRLVVDFQQTRMNPCIACGWFQCVPDCAIAKALKETE